MIFQKQNCGPTKQTNQTDQLTERVTITQTHTASELPVVQSQTSAGGEIVRDWPGTG